MTLFWFALLTTVDLAFLEQFLNSRYAPILTVIVFPMVMMGVDLYL